MTPTETTWRTHAAATLAAPPRWPWTERHEGKGRLVISLVLPLELVPTSNVGIRHRQAWALEKERRAVAKFMSPQVYREKSATLVLCDGKGPIMFRWTAPLPGRPMLRAIRFSSRQPDDTSAWWKTVGDVLLPPRRTRTGRMVVGFGVLAADDPEHLETRAWGEYAPPGHGFGLVEIWTGG
jgi:hypothetical protein